jgi:hypothetical protein
MVPFIAESWEISQDKYSKQGNQMTALDRTPINPNYLNPLNFRFQLQRAPNIEFFIQKVAIPGISMTQIKVPTVFQPIPHSGKLEFEQFNIDFKVDEDFQNYIEIYDWMIDLGFPDNFDEYAVINAQKPETGFGLTSDISLLVMDALRNPNYIITMKDAFPIALKTLPFGSTDNDVKYVTGSATFAYFKFTIERYER